MADLDIALILRLIDRASGPLRAVGTRLQGLRDMVGRADLAGIASRADAVAARARAGALETAALGASLAAGLRPAIAFEAALGDIAKVVEFDSPDGIKALGRDILDLSKTVPIAASGIADIVAAAGRAGVVDSALPDDAQRAELIAFARDAAAMATAFGTSAAESGAAMATFREVLRLNQEQVVLLGDAVNALADSMNTNERDVVNFLTRAGSAGDVFGLLPEQTAALGASLMALGTPAEIAARAVNNMLVRLAAPDRQSKAFIAALDEIGLSAEEMKRLVGEDAVGAIDAFLAAIRAAPQGEQIGLLSDLIGNEFGDEIVKLVNSQATLDGALARVSDSTAFAGDMMRTFAARSALTEARLQALSNQGAALAIAAGTILLPALNDLVGALVPLAERAAAWAEANPELIRTIAALAVGVLAWKAAMVLVIGPVAQLVALGARLLSVLRFLPLLISGPVAVAIAALAAGAALLFDRWEPFRTFVLALWQDVQTVFEGAATALRGLIDGDFAAIAEGLKMLFSGVAGFVGTLFEGILGTIGELRAGLVALLGLDEEANRAALDRAGANLEANRRPGNAFVGPGPTPRAAGGPVVPGRPFLVGEEGPEIVEFGARGFVTPNAMLGGTGAGARSISAPITVNAAPGMDAQAVARAVRREIEALMEADNDLHDGALFRGAG